MIGKSNYVMIILGRGCQQAYLTSPFCASAEGKPIDLNTVHLPDDEEVRINHTICVLRDAEHYRGDNVFSCTLLN